MALTRAQLLSGDTNNGVVLAGQPQGVRPGGTGITIDTNGIISVDSSTITGVMKLNNTGAYNSYIWPASPINKKFLQTDGAGLLSWSDPSGFAVVTVQSQPAPTPADVGELWFDCTTGTLNVYQNCVGTPSPNWFNVAQPGLPVLPSNTSSAPAFTGGNGTQATPYDCTVTTAGAGSSVFVVNVVTIVGLAPFQFVPIVDLNAVTNGGRFSFTNNYADASGSLTFETVFTDQPPSPPATSYTAAIKVGYGTVYVDAIVNIVTALTVTGGTITGPAYSGNELTYTPGTPSGGSSPYTLAYQWLRDGVAIPSATALTYTLVTADVGTTITAKTTVTDSASQTASGTSNSIGPIAAAAATLAITSAGSIAPSSSVSVGAVLTYTTGTFTGGVPTVTASWVWERAGVAIAGTANAATYTTVTADAGQAITVTYTVTDSATPTAATANQTTTSVTPTTPFIPSVWTPTPSNGLDSNPGGQTGTYNGTATSITTTGCVEASVNGGAYSTGTQAITSGQSLAVRWASTSGCGGAASGTTITGTITDGTYTNSYSLAVNRKPTAFGFTAGSTSAPLISVQTSNTVTITGINSVSYVTVGSLTAGATSLEASINGGGFVAIPTSTSTSLPIVTGETLQIRFTTGSTASTTYTAVVNIGDGDAVQFTASSPGFVVINTSSPVFPSTTFAPSAGPTASPANTVLTGTPALNGTATATWSDGSTSLTATGSLQFQVNGGGYTQTSTAVANGNTVDLRWNPTAAASAADAASLTGTLTNSTYINTYTLVVDKQPSAYTWTDQTSVTVSSTVTSNVVTIADINCPAELTYTAGATNTLTSVQASIDGGAFTNIPTSSPGLVINPADAAGTAATTIQLRATVGAGLSTAYTLTTNIGKGAAVVSDEWSVTTSAATPTITTPSITSPANGTTNLNPTLNTPAGIPLVGDSYSANNGAGGQTSSEWEVYKWNGLATSAITSTSLGSYVTLNPAYATSIGSYSDGNLTYTQTASGNQATFSTVALSGKMYWEITLNGNSNNTPGLDVLSAPGTTTVPGNTTGFGWETSAGAINLAGVRTGGYPTASPGDVIGWAFDSSTGAIRIFLNGAEVSFSPQTLSVGTYYAAFGTSVASDTGATYNFGATAFSYTAPAGYGTLGSLSLTFTDATNLTNMTVGDTLTQTTTYTPVSDTISSVAAGPILTLSGNTQLGNFFVGDTVTEVGGSGDATGVISAINSTTAPYTITLGSSTGTWNASSQVQGPATAGQGPIFAINSGSSPFTITLSGSTGAWGVGKIAIDAQSTPVAPATTPPDSTEYTAFPGSPIINSVSPFLTVDLLQAFLVPSSTYYGRVRYATTNTTATTSSFSAWSSFGTAAGFSTGPGTAMAGGYFGGQINDGGTIYNLIVAPVADGQYPGGGSGGTPTTVQYKTTNSADAPSATFQNEVYGKSATDTGNNAAYPAFQWASALNIGGFNDWYIPAKNELSVLYFFLKPTTAGNNTSTGSNANSVSPYTPNTNYGTGFPSQTTSTLFQSAGSESFAASTYYWTSTENAGSTANAYAQNFIDGEQNGTYPKDYTAGIGIYARAIRRVAA